MDIIDILWWVILILFVFIVAWYVLGSSPTLDTIMLILSFAFLLFALESRRDMKEHMKDTNFVKEKLNDIYNVLKERLK